MREFAFCLGVGLILSTNLFAADQSPLVGNWKLVSNQIVIGNGTPQDYPAPSPRGYLLLTAQGRMMVLMTSSERKFGTSDADSAQLFKSMFAYSGKYRIEGRDFITTVDISSFEAPNGTEQRRHYTIDGDRLTIVSDPQPNPFDQSKSLVGTTVWEREK